MEIVNLTKDLFDGAMECYKEGIDSHIATFNKEIPDYESFDKSHKTFGRLAMINKNEVAGFCVLSPFAYPSFYDGVLEVSIYVKKEYQGLHVGSKLMERLIEISEREGVWTLVAHIIALNSKSIAFHEKMGFRIVGLREKLAKDYRGIWLDTVLMERRSNIVL